MATTKTPLSNANYASTEYDSQGFVNSDVVSAVAGVFGSAVATNKSSSAVLYLMLFDSATVPVNGTKPMMCPIALQPGGTGQGGSGRQLSNGLSYAVSTTAATLTIDTTSSVWVTVDFG